jgi:hypothetical protein
VAPPRRGPEEAVHREAFRALQKPSAQRRRVHVVVGDLVQRGVGLAERPPGFERPQGAELVGALGRQQPADAGHHVRELAQQPRLFAGDLLRRRRHAEGADQRPGLEVEEVPGEPLQQAARRQRHRRRVERVERVAADVPVVRDDLLDRVPHRGHQLHAGRAPRERGRGGVRAEHVVALRQAP